MESSRFATPPRWASALLVALVAAPALAQPRPPQAPPSMAPLAAAPARTTQAQAMEGRLNALMARPGGLTADEVARRAENTSLDVVVRKSDIISAAATVDQAYAAFFPRLNLFAKYTRFNDIAPASLFGPPANAPAGTKFGLVATSPQTNNSVMGQQYLTPCANGIGAGCDPLFFVDTSSLSFKILSNQTILTASLTIPLSDYVLRSVQGLAAAAASKRAADLSLRATRLKVRADARALYYNWVRARLQQEVTSQALADAQGHLVDVKALFGAGMASQADVMKVESQVAGAELLVERTRNLTRVLGDSVATVMHDPAAATYEIGEDLHATLPDLPEVSGDTAPLVDEAAGKRLELKALDENHTTLVQQARTVRAGYYPSVSAFGDLSYLNPNQRVFPVQERFDTAWDVGVQASWSPNDAAVSHANARGIDAKAAQLEAQKRQLADGVRAEVMQAWSAMREARVSLDTTSRQLASSEEAYRVRRELWKVGRATAIELTDAETDLTQARLQAVNAAIDLRVAAVRLIHAVGRDIGEK